MCLLCKLDPSCKWVEVQQIQIVLGISVVLLQVCLEYAQHVVKAGLTEDGLRAMYESGNGNVNDDYEALGFSATSPLKPEQATLLPSLSQQI